MNQYEQYSAEYDTCWQRRIVKTNFVAATVVLIFEIAYFFILSAIGLRDQTPLEYILRYILLPAGIIFTLCTIGWFIVYRSRLNSEAKSLAAILTMVSLCTGAASIHNIFAATLCSFFVPLAVSVVFGTPHITNIVGSFCIAGEVIALFFASMDLRGKDPYFLPDCLMLFIVFGISWYATLLLMKNEREKRDMLDNMWQSRIALCTSNEHLEDEVKDRKQAQEALRLQLEQHQIITNQATDILFEWDILKDTLSFSPNWYKKFGYSPINSQISGRIPLSKNIHPDDVPAFTRIIKDMADGTPYSEAELRIKNSKGLYAWCRVRATAQFDLQGHPVKAVGVILDINAETEEKQTLLKMAQRDPLTGIYNKAATNALVTRLMKDSDRTVLQALLIVDIDYFKTVNDTYGHMAGDNILSAVATQLRSHIQAGDVVGRIGGDEFLVYFPEVENEGVALRKAENLRTALGLLRPEWGAPPITCSVGMAVFPHGVVEYSDLFRYADVALYLRKEKGRNGVTAYDTRGDKDKV